MSNYVNKKKCPYCKGTGYIGWGENLVVTCNCSIFNKTRRKENMKQVKLWIEYCPITEQVAWVDSSNAPVSLLLPIRAIIENRLDTVEGSEFIYLKPNESRESIIEALWQLQKSMLPDDYRLKDNKILKLVGSEDFMTPEYEKIATFYDPETRIITVTDFEQEADQ